MVANGLEWMEKWFESAWCAPSQNQPNTIYRYRLVDLEACYAFLPSDTERNFIMLVACSTGDFDTIFFDTSFIRSGATSFGSFITLEFKWWVNRPKSPCFTFAVHSVLQKYQIELLISFFGLSRSSKDIFILPLRWLPMLSIKMCQDLTLQTHHWRYQYFWFIFRWESL